jgi:polar amino acid transport system substrate-binding protein
MSRLIASIALVLLTGFAAPGLFAQAERPLTVGIKHTPPYVIHQADGSWHGISVDLWEQIAAELGLRFRFEECTLTQMLERLEAGRIDVGVAALTITSDREEKIDFTHPFHTSGLGIAEPTGGGAGWTRILARFPLMAFLKVLVWLMVALLVAAILLWLFERRRNAEQFGSGLQGIGAGFWWAAVTLTTVGYGDKAPRTFAGRLVGFVWMFISLFVVAGFTATVASILTTSRLESAIDGPDDLGHLRVATVAGSTSAAYLERKHVTPRLVGTPLAALETLRDRQVDAVVYDAPILRYLSAHEIPGVAHVLPYRFEVQHYAFGLPEGSRLREAINRVLLKKTLSPEWSAELEKYLDQ